MPRVTETRTLRAAALLKKLKNGPSLSDPVDDTITTAEAEKRVRLWLESWITPEVIHLVPEIRNALRKGGALRR